MATRFLQDFTNRLITEAFFAEQLGSYNMPTGIDSGAIKRHKDKTVSMGRAADRVLDRAVDVTDALGAQSIVGMPMVNATLRDVQRIRDRGLGLGQDIGTDEYEGRRAQGVQDRLAAGEQTAPPSGGQAMGMRATSPGDEKRIEDLTHTRRRPMIAPGVSDGSGRTVHPPVHGPIPSAPPAPTTPPIPSGIGVGVGPGTVRGSGDAPTDPAGSGLRNFIPSRFGGSMSKRERSRKDTIAGSVIDDFRRRYSADNEFKRKYK